jgi:hypothetical protein
MANLDYNDFRPCDCVWRMVLPANSLKLLINLLRYVLVAGTLALLGAFLYTVATEKYEKRV